MILVISQTLTGLREAENNEYKFNVANAEVLESEVGFVEQFGKLVIKINFFL